jgi:hypothetical protein
MALHLIAEDVTPGSQPLDDGRREAFCHFCALGVSQSQAYLKAGYSPHSNPSGNATRLTGDDGVRERIAFLRHAAAQAVQWDLEKLIIAADDARRQAQQLGQMTAVCLAVKEIGILTGLRVEQREVRTARLEDMSTAELRAIAAQGRALLPAPDASGD